MCVPCRETPVRRRSSPGRTACGKPLWCSQMFNAVTGSCKEPWNLQMGKKYQTIYMKSYSYIHNFILSDMKVQNARTWPEPFQRGYTTKKIRLSQHDQHQEYKGVMGFSPKKWVVVIPVGSSSSLTYDRIQVLTLQPLPAPTPCLSPLFTTPFSPTGNHLPTYCA